MHYVKWQQVNEKSVKKKGQRGLVSIVFPDSSTIRSRLARLGT